MQTFSDDDISTASLYLLLKENTAFVEHVRLFFQNYQGGRDAAQIAFACIIGTIAQEALNEAENGR